MQFETLACDFRRKERSRSRLLHFLVAPILAFFWATTAVADAPMTEAEYLLLPAYCKAQGNVSERFYKKYYIAERTRKWQSGLGLNYEHYHHYCWGLVSIMRAYKSTSQYGSRASLIKNGIADIGYALERATPDFILLPEIYTKLGEAYLLSRDDKNAEASFRKAWEIKPDYWRPYVWWAQRLMQLGKFREALLVAEEGQRNAPGTKSLESLVNDIHATMRGKKK